MKNIWKLSGALCVVAVGMAGCGGGSDGPSPPKTNGGTTAGGTTGGTTGGNNAVTYTQQERLARPVVNEVLATVAEHRHRINNIDNPTDDAGQLASDVRGFMKFPAGRSDEIANVVTSVLIPDVMVADLSKSGPAAYLGVETNGATGGTFGGRKLQDDVVDISLGVIFGTTVSDLGLAADDGKAIPTLTTDNVDASGHQYSNSFPYLQAPN